MTSLRAEFCDSVVQTIIDGRRAAATLFAVTMSRFFATSPEELTRHALAGPSPVRVPDRGDSVRIGALGFCVASLAVFGSWALMGGWMFRTFGELGAYLIWTVAIFAVGGWLLAPLVLGPRRLGKFYALFVAAFLVYAVGWMIAWFASPNRAGEWLGSVLGPIGMALVLCGAFRAWSQAAGVMVVLCVSHAVGYFAGAAAFDHFRNALGMILWGLCYGFGFGAGIGDTFFRVQGEARARLRRRLADTQDKRSDAMIG